MAEGDAQQGDDVLVPEGPDPNQASDLAEFIQLLQQLRIARGTPSYRTLARRTGALLRPPQVTAHTTISGIFDVRRQRLDLDLVVAVVRALGLSESAVDQWRQACVRVHVEAKTGGAAGVLRQLPADLATFTGRDREVAGLLATVDSAAAAGVHTVVVSAIEGMGGVGKTQLAIHVAHRLVRAGRFADAQLYVDLRGFDPDRPPADPAVVLDSFLRALQVPSQQIPARLEDRAAMFRDRLHDKRALVLLDNAADEAQVRDLIPASPTCLVLITSRRSLADVDGAALTVLDVFSRAEALQLLNRIAGAARCDSDPAAAEAVIKACGRLPLAVALAASRLRSRPSWPLAHLAERLRGGSLDEARSANRVLRDVFDLSYQGLPQPEQRLFRLLGLHPGDAIGAAAAAALADVSLTAAHRLLETLLDEHLLQEKAPDYYTMHDLVRAYAVDRVLAVEPQADRDSATDRLLSWYIHAGGAAADQIAPWRRPVDISVIPAPAAVPRFADSRAAFDWCERELGNISAVVRLAHDTGRHALAWQVPLSLQIFFQARNYREEYTATQTLALDSVRSANLHRLEPRILAGITNALRKSERPAEAVESGMLMHDLSIRYGDRVSEGIAANLVALAYEDMKDYEAAVGWALTAAALTKDVGTRYQQATALHLLAQCYLKTERLAEARDTFEEALDLYATDPDADAGARSYLLEGLGPVLAGEGRHTEAAEHLRTAAALHQQHGRDLDVASALSTLAETLLAAGDTAGNRTQAAESWRGALAIYVEHQDSRAERIRRSLSALDE